MDSGDVRRAATAAGDSKVLVWGARAGYVVSAVVHLLIGLLGLQVAFGGAASEAADQSGALRMLAGNPLGAGLLLASAASLGLLAAWQLTEVAGRRDTGERLKAAGKMIGYAALALTAVGVFQGTRESSADSAQNTTGTLLSLPFGQVLVAAAGLAVVGIGGYHVVKGVRSRFLRDLVEHPPRAVVWAGRLGYTAKGLALVAAGVLLVLAAVQRRPEEARGLDGALRAFLALPFGNAVLAAIAAGFMAYAAYGVVRAKLARL